MLISLFRDIRKVSSFEFTIPFRNFNINYISREVNTNRIRIAWFNCLHNTTSPYLTTTRRRRKSLTSIFGYFKKFYKRLLKRRTFINYISYLWIANSEGSCWSYFLCVFCYCFCHYDYSIQIICSAIKKETVRSCTWIGLE